MDRERIEANIAIARSRGSVHWYALAQWFADDCEQLLAALAAAEAENARRDDRDEWLSRQVAGMIEAADAVAHTTGLAIARALAGDLRDAEKALASRPGEGAA